MWVKVKDYAEETGISTQAVYKRIRKGHISEDRVRKNDGNVTEILLVDVPNIIGSL